MKFYVTELCISNGVVSGTNGEVVEVNYGDCITLEYISGDVDLSSDVNVADIVIWSGDPLEVTTFVEEVYISGKRIPTKNRSMRLKDRYIDN